MALAARYDVPYVHIERHVTLRDDDFADLFHLLAPARLKWQPEMARELASTLDGSPRPVASWRRACSERPADAQR